jgi:hypothetical protein
MGVAQPAAAEGSSQPYDAYTECVLAAADWAGPPEVLAGEAANCLAARRGGGELSAVGGGILQG